MNKTISLFDLENYCNRHNYDILPILTSKGYVCHVYFNNRLIKKGLKTYRDFYKCKKDSYLIIYEKLKNST